jgi:hypothetical protein
MPRTVEFTVALGAPGTMPTWKTVQSELGFGPSSFVVASTFAFGGGALGFASSAFAAAVQNKPTDVMMPANSLAFMSKPFLLRRKRISGARFGNLEFRKSPMKTPPV